MARLISRTQVEEIKDFIRDTSFSQNVSISGSLLVSQSFDIGSAPDTKSTITGSVELTGSLTIDGPLNVIGDQALNATASVSLKSIDTQLFGGIKPEDFGAEEATLFVSSTSGDDNNDGRTPQFALRTVKKAAELAEAGDDGRFGLPTGSLFSGFRIEVSSGTYLEENPIELPKNTTVWGSGLRVTKIVAKNENEDLFWVNSGCYLSEMTFAGLRVFPSVDDSRSGFAIAFAPNSFITTSPYIQNCSMISNQENSFLEKYEKIPAGGGGLNVDGNIIHPDSPLASMVLDAYTQIAPNGVGCQVVGRGFIQLVSFFTNFSAYSVKVIQGGQAVLLNSNTSFGDFGMYASGSRFITGSGGNLEAFNRVRDGYTIIIDTIEDGLTAIPEFIPNTNAGVKVTDELQQFSNNNSSNVVAEQAKSEYRLVSNIVSSGISNIPSLLAKSATRGYNTGSVWNISFGNQITGSTSATSTELDIIDDRFTKVKEVLELGARATASYTLVDNIDGLIKATNTVPYIGSDATTQDEVTIINRNFNTVLQIVERGLNNEFFPLPPFTSSNAANIKVTETPQYNTDISSSAEVANKVSSSFATVFKILELGSDYAPTTIQSSSIENPSIDFQNGYDTLIGNLSFIQNETIAYLSSSWSESDYNEVTCKRDIGHIVNGAAADLLYGGNEQSILNGKFYYLYPSEATASQKQETLDAIRYAGGLAESLVGDITYVEPSINVENGYDLLVNNKSFIQNEVISFVSSSWRSFEYDEVKCKRDVGHVINAVATDLRYGGNERSRIAGEFYYLYPSTATTTQLLPTLDGIEWAKDLSKKLVVKETFVTASAIIQSTYDLIVENRSLIQEETVNFIDTQFPNLVYLREKCKRDTGYIVDAVSTDLYYGGNQKSVRAGLYYNEVPSKVNGDQLNETVDGISYAKSFIDKVITNQIVEPPTVINNTYARVRAGNVLQFVSSSVSGSEIERAKVSSSFGIVEDIIKQGEDSLLAAIAGNTPNFKWTLEEPKLVSGVTLVESSITASSAEVKSISSSFEIVTKIIESGSSINTDKTIGSASNGLPISQVGIPKDSYGDNLITTTIGTKLPNDIVAVTNVNGNIKFNDNSQITSSISASVSTASSISESFRTVIDIIEYGISGSKEISGSADSSSYFEVVSLPNDSTAFYINDDQLRYFDGREGYALGGEDTGSFVGSKKDPTLTLVRNEMYNFSINDLGFEDTSINSPFLIKTKRTAGTVYDVYESIGLINNGITFGTITFTPLEDTPDTLFYVNPTNASASGVINIVDSLPLSSEQKYVYVPTKGEFEKVVNTKDNIKVTNGIQYTSSLDASVSDRNIVSGGFSTVVGILKSGVDSYTPTSATYNPADGEFVINISQHGLDVDDRIYLKPESFVFTCDMDGNRTEHKLPSVGQPAYNKQLTINSITDNTISVNVGKSGPNIKFTPTTASYDPATGDFSATVGKHTLSVGEGIILSEESFAFTCDMDNDQSVKSYPRIGIDPFAVRSIPITSVTDTTLTFNVGVSGPNKTFTPTATSYNALTGDMIVTVGQHGLGIGRSVVLENESFAFTCDQDGGATTHSYPRLGSDPYAGKSIPIISVGNTSHTPTNAPYNASTGLVTLTIAGHGFSNGDYIKVEDGALTYSCVLDGNSVSKSYPRAGYDYPSGRWIQISNVTTDTFDINIGSSSYTGAHTFVSATAGGIKRQTGTFTINVGNGGTAQNSLHTFVSASANAVKHKPQSPHTFVSASLYAIQHLPQSNHTFVRTNINSVTTLPILTKTIDGLVKRGNVTQYTSSLVSSETLISKLSSSFETVLDIIEFGTGSTPTSASYDPADGDFVMTIPNHKFKKADSIYLKPESFTFTCDMDNNKTEHILPSVGQPAYNNKLRIKSVTDNTITVNVGKSGPNVEFTPSTASYNPATGDFVMTVGTHSLSVGEGIVLDTHSFAFTCDMDNNQSVKSYPRLGIDPYAGRSIIITDITDTTLTVNVGVSSPNKYFTPSNVNYNSLSGDMVVTVGQHGLGVSRSVVLENESFAFTCDQDGNATTHSYPRSGSDPYAEQSIKITSVGTTTHTPTDAPYNATTGVVTLTIAEHGFSNGDYIKVDDSGLTYTCVLDGNSVTKSYPRAGYDNPSGRWLAISNVTTNTFDINIGASSYKGTHTFVSATTNGIKRQTGTFTINVGDGGSASGSIHTFVSASTNAVKHEPQSIHTFVSSSRGAVKHLPQSVHTFVRTINESVSVIPPKVENTEEAIAVGIVSQFTTSSISASASDISFISESFEIVTRIIEFGSGSYESSSLYGSEVTSSTTVAAYNLLKSNIGFIQEETIAYLSSSWSSASYNELSCSRDIAGIVSGAAEDLIHNVYSASVFNGKFYLEYPSEAENSQLNQTLDGIRYASRLAQNIASNVVFSSPAQDRLNTQTIIVNNKNFIKEEAISFLSSSWSSHNHPEEICKRDIVHILDASITDIVYGGNERTINAGVFYWKFPSEATGSQLFPTLDGIEYAGEVAQKVVSGAVFVPPTSTKVNAYNLVFDNKDLIQNEVIEYVSSSWNAADYDDIKCKRDTGYIIDAAITDLLYGGNERSIIAGDFYYKYPSKAQGSQLDQTVDGIVHAQRLSDKVMSNTILVNPSVENEGLYQTIEQNRELVQAEVIAYISSSWVGFDYNEAKCSRDVGHILDAVSTDLRYGGNERSVVAGEYYYLYPSEATSVQKSQTIDGIVHAANLVQKLIQNVILSQPSATKLSIWNSIRNNRTLIQKEVTEYIDYKYPFFTYNREKCRRDVGHILDGVATDFLWGGNQRSIKSGEFYYLFPSEATTVQKDETIDGIMYAKNLVTDIITQKQFTPTTATYDPSNGDFVMTIPNHNLDDRDEIYIKSDSFVFTCTMDGNKTEHKLPSVGQPAYNTKLGIKSVTNDTITVNVGKSGPNVQFNPTNASYDPATGEFVITTGTHSLSVGEGIVLDTGSFAFTCEMDNDQSVKSYPRFGIDPFAGRSMIITDVTDTTMTVNVGVSAPNKLFTPTDVNYNALSGDMIVTAGQHGLGIGRSVVLENESFAFTCDQDGDSTTHSYPRLGSDPYAEKSIVITSVGTTSHTITNAPYDASTGDVTITIANHNFSNGDYIKIDDNGLTYTCLLDGNSAEKSYPRAGYDNPSGRWLEISNVTTNTFDINIGSSSNTSAHTFISATNNGLKRQTGTFTINVGDGGSASGSIHTFVSASTNAVKHLPQSIHTFVSASNGAVKHLPQAGHTFVRTQNNSISVLSQLITKSPSRVSNTDGNIKVTSYEAVTSSIALSGSYQTEVSESYGVVTGIICDGINSFTPTNATYDPSNGDFVMTINEHGLTTKNGVYLRPESFTFTCDMDGNRSEHNLPSVGQPSYNKRTKIKSITEDTITLNVGKSGPNVEFNPTTASYDPATGDFVVTVASHSLSVGEGIIMVSESFAFTCDMDNDQSVKSYPRVGIDPYSVRSIPLTAVTDTTMTFNVGASGPNKYFTPVSASYNALSGDMTLTVSESFGLGIGRSVVLENESIAFTCDMDSNLTTHSYPRSGSDPYAEQSIIITSIGKTNHSVTNAPYNSATGDVTITIANHNFNNGDYIKLDDNSLTYTCVLDGNTTTKSYPRPNYDYPSGRWLEISNVTTNTFDINIGSSPYVGSHTFVSATTNGLERQDGTFTINVGDGGSASGSIHTFVSSSDRAVKHLPQSLHTFISSSNGAIKHLPQSNHTFIRTEQSSVSTVPVLSESIEDLIKVSGTSQFTSSLSGSGIEAGFVTRSVGFINDIIKFGTDNTRFSLAKWYDDTLDTPQNLTTGSYVTASGTYTTDNEFNIVSSSFGQIIDIIENGTGSFTPTNATYDPANGNFVISISNHNLNVGDEIYIRPESFTFTCDMDGNKTEHILPSVGQPAYSGVLPITSKTTNTITVNVGISGPNVSFTPTNATYDPSNGDFVITTGRHNLSIGEGIVLDTGSFAFTCDMDDNQSIKSYPRLGIDPYANRSIKITSITGTTMTVNVGVSGPNKTFKPVSASYDGLSGDMILTVSESFGLGVGRSVVLENESISFTCDQDDNATTHSYPRLGSDPYAGKSIKITSVGKSLHTPTDAPYNSSTGDVIITIANHGFSNGDYIKVSDNGLTYTCILDGNTISKSYPRAGYDSPSGRWIPITNVTTNTFKINIGSSSYVGKHKFISAQQNSIERQTGTFTINVGDAGSASGSIHTFVSSSANAVKHEPQSVHTFVSASTGAVKHLPQSVHTFVRTTKDSISILPAIVSNTTNNIKVTDTTQFTSSIVGSVTEVNKVKSSIGIVENILINGTSVKPLVHKNNSDKNNLIKATDAVQITSASFGDRLQQRLISSSIAIVTNIVENGTGSLPTLVEYGTPSDSPKTLAAYNLLKDNIEFIQSESIAYLSSSWSTASYDESKCSRDIGGIISGAAEDMLHNANSASIFNGKFYYDFPSQAQGAQLQQTLDGINYAGRLAESIVRGYTFQTASAVLSGSVELIRNNREFIENETIAFLSSSWDGFTYNEITCKRDVTHIIDAVSTDLLYGGNERSVNAGDYYYRYPSAAITGGVPNENKQKDPTVTAVDFVQGFVSEIVSGAIFQTASNEVEYVYESIRNNREFIQSETVQFVNAKYPNLDYKEASCKRDTGFIIDAVATDLRYGGNQRALTAGEFYYRFPSKATGVQIEETTDALIYARDLIEKIVDKETLFIPTGSLNTDNKIKITSFSPAAGGDITDVTILNTISSSFSIVSDAISNGKADVTPTNATYNPTTGNFVMTIVSHSFDVGEGIYLKPESFTFTCDMDNNKTEHSLPSVGQPAYNKELEIVSKTDNTITLNVGVSGPNVEFNPTTASYNPATGDFVMTVESHSLSIGEGIVLDPESFAFTCDMDNNQSVKSYPRVGIDPFAGRSMKITSITGTTMTVNAGVSGPNKYFTPSNVNYNALSGDMVVTVGQHGLGVSRSVVLENESFAFTCDQDGNSTIHSYPRSGSDPYAEQSIKITSVGTTSHTVTNAPYNASTGDITITISEHGFSNGDYIKLSDNSLTYTCVLDGDTVEKSYPRTGIDTPSNRWLVISNVTTNTFDINIGSSSYTSAHTFVSATTDGLERQTGTFTINVGDGGSASGSIHTFVSASTNAVKHEPQSPHTFISASNGAIKHLPQSLHTFVRTQNESVSVIQPATDYGSVSTDVDILSAYGLITESVPFIQNEVVEYISSSWYGFDYDSAKCRRDIGFIVNGVAEDLRYGIVSASSVNAKFYYQFPSEANGTGSQSQQTVDGINYASQLANQIVKGATFNSPSTQISASVELLRNNRGFIQSESISYLSSSWEGFDFVEATCARDVGHIIDAVSTDLLYGGSQRSKIAGEYYYKYPSTATTTQLEPTTTGIKYAGDLGSNLVEGKIFVTASIEKLAGNKVLLDNKEFIQNEVIAYISSSWSTFDYNEDKCKRDTGYILNGVATDFLYGGNERSKVNGEYYFEKPSDATLNYQVTGDATKTVFVTPTNATYNPANGDFVMTVGTHRFNVGDSISLSTESFTFTCDMDGNKTEHSLPSIGQPAYNNKLLITSKTNDTITVNVGVSGPNVEFNPTNATYNPATGDFVITTGTHSLSVGEGIVLDPQSFAFTCDMDNNQSVKSYPRVGIDPYAARSIKITSITGTTMTVNVGISAANKLFTPTDVNYNALSGDMVVNVGQHGLGVGRSVVLENESFAFTCDQDGDSTTHSYPRSGSDPYAEQSIVINSVGTTSHTVFNAPYNATTGDITLTIYNHNFSNGDYIKLSDNSLSYTCVLDGDTVEKSYPRAGYDNPSGRWLEISNVTTNTFDINIGASSYTSAHTFVSATRNGLERQTGTFTINVGDGGSASGSIHTFVSASTNAVKHLPQSVHTFVSASTGAVKHLPQSNHTFVRTKRNSVSVIIPAIGQLNQTIDGINYSARLAGKVLENATFVSPTTEVSASAELLRNNRSFVQNETIEFISSSWSNVTYSEDKCRRDTGYIIDAAITDLVYGGNERSTVAGLYYWKYPSRATKGGTPSEANQLDPTVDGIRFANGTSQNVVQNLLYTTPSDEIKNGVQLLRDNTTFIQKETIAYLSSSWSEFEYNEVSCSRDLGYIIDAVATDLTYGGNERAVQAGTFYYYIPSIATTEQKPQTTDGIDFSKGLAEKIIKQKQLVFPFLLNKNGANALRNAKKVLQGKAISYTNAAFPTFDYNEEKCYRDTGFILDAIVTDITYGGNERSIRAAESYYNGVYGSAAVVINEQKLETAETNRYLRTQFQFVARQAPVEEFGSLIITTGHDFSYAGAGVTYKALPPNQGGDGIPDPDKEITEIGGGRVFFTSGNELGDFRIGGGLVIKQASGTLEGRTFSKSLFSLVTPFSLALQD